MPVTQINPNIDNPIHFQDIVIHGNTPPSPTGEFGSYTADETTQLDRLFNCIETLVTDASYEHKKANCDFPSGQLRPDSQANVTRLITNEFTFYTSTPLSLQEFEHLQNKIAQLTSQQPVNLHLVLSSFAVRTPDNKVMNVVAHVECGQDPTFNFIVKNNPSEVDPVYEEFDSNGYYSCLENVDIKKNDQVNHLKINLNSTEQAFSFNNVMECQAANGAKFINCIDICLDHNEGVGKNNLNKMLIDSAQQAAQGQAEKQIPLQCSHIVTSNWTYLSPTNAISLITHADPVLSKTTPKADVPGTSHVLKPSSFGTQLNATITASAPSAQLSYEQRYYAISNNINLQKKEYGQPPDQFMPYYPSAPYMSPAPDYSHYGVHTAYMPTNPNPYNPILPQHTINYAYYNTPDTHYSYNPPNNYMDYYNFPTFAMPAMTPFMAPNTNTITLPEFNALSINQKPAIFSDESTEYESQKPAFPDESTNYESSPPDDQASIADDVIFVSDENTEYESEPPESTYSTDVDIDFQQDDLTEYEPQPKEGLFEKLSSLPVRNHPENTNEQNSISHHESSPTLLFNSNTQAHGRQPSHSKQENKQVTQAKLSEEAKIQLQNLCNLNIKEAYKSKEPKSRSHSFLKVFTKAHSARKEQIERLEKGLTTLQTALNGDQFDKVQEAITNLKQTADQVGADISEEHHFAGKSKLSKICDDITKNLLAVQTSIEPKSDKRPDHKSLR